VPTEGNAIAALVCAIASFAICPLIPAIVALFLAASADRNIAASGGMKEGAGLSRAAKIVAWINIGLCAFGLVILVAIAASASGS
jgi:hypothetical protein